MFKRVGSPEISATSDESDDDGGRFPPKPLTSVHQVLEDFKVSYVGTLRFDEPEIFPKGKWKVPKKPIHDITKVPKGWSPIDYGIDPSDTDALIKRCRERIAENVMPHIFEKDLKSLLERKAKEDKLHASEPEGVSFNAAKRIKQLNEIKKWLEGNGDEFNYLPTVKAITKAYKKKELDWNLGLVTYWIDGKPICQPRVHDMQAVAIITQDPKFKEGFWVEGSRLAGPLPPGPDNLNALAGNHYRLYPKVDNNQGTGIRANGSALCYEPTAAEGPFQVKMNMRLKIAGPDTHPWTFEFSDDTGADYMTLYKDDVFTIYNANLLGNPMAQVDPNTPLGLRQITPVLGVADTRLADGTNALHYVITLYFNLEAACPEDDMVGLGYNQEFFPIEALIRDGNIQGVGAPRLNGPAMRVLFNTVSTNTDMIRLYIVENLHHGTTYAKKPQRNRRPIKLPDAPKALLPANKPVTAMFDPGILAEPEENVTMGDDPMTLPEFPPAGQAMEYPANVGLGALGGQPFPPQYT
ncbi:hypothetical protein N7533_003472 [Penicillium manginii]|uniref:uncharacterized protein n=1 Tax=Penicillium manginii TaxID=203109 RepID=UPI0025487890|nr:uncharacterized protein N7533_003472 [Penicillium manginii]KAJ5761433.1 hypothetical protein N7533_003472 [Penicillium manginii]